MRVDDLRPELAERPAQEPVGLRVDPRPDRPDQLGHHLDLQPEPLRPVEQVPLRPLGGTGDEGHIIAVAMVQTLDRQQGVLLRSAENQPRDDVYDAHREP